MTKQTTALAKRTSTKQANTGPISPMEGEVVKPKPQGQRTFQFISNTALKLGLHVCGGPGAGKSRAVGRICAWEVLLSKQPGVILDPKGGIIDNLCDKIFRLPPGEQEPLWQRIVYQAPGRKDFLCSSPLYYPLHKTDTLFEIANRFPAVLKRIDPDLTSAPILGWNSLYECAIYAGELAAALGEQLDFVADLIEHPGQYKVQLRQALAAYPELKPAVEYFRALMDPSASSLREKKTGSLKSKLLPFLADPVRMATYAAKTNRLNWQKLLKQRKVILIDYRHQLDPDHLQFDMVWHLRTFMDAIKQRGMAGRGQEVTLIIDEITAMLGQRTNHGHSILAEDLEELIAVLARNYAVNPIICHQNLSQLDERIQNVLMQMGSQLIGQLSNPEDALRVAQQLFRYDPFWLKKTENVWHTITPLSILSFFGGPSYPYPQVIDKKLIEYTPQEQLLLWINKILDLDRFQFYAQIASGEGGKRGPVKKITLANLDKAQYPQEELLAPLRSALAKRDGIPLAELLPTLSQPRQRGEPPTPKQPAKKPATLKHTHVPPDPISQSEQASSVSSANEGGEAHASDEPVFQ